MGPRGLSPVARVGSLHGIGSIDRAWWVQCRLAGFGWAIALNGGCGLTNPTAGVSRLHDVHLVVGAEVTSGMMEAVVGMRWELAGDVDGLLWEREEVGGVAAWG